MRALLTAICSFTILASTWLFTMFLILRHPHFERGAAVSLGLVVLSVATIALTRLHAPPEWLRVSVAVSAALVLALAAWAFIENLRGDDFEGYILIISVALTMQGLLTLWWSVSAQRSALTSRHA